MAQCQFCGRGGRGEKRHVKEWDSKINEHLIFTKDAGNHIHIHGPIDDKALLKEFADVLIEIGGVEIDKSAVRPVSTIDKSACQFCDDSRTVSDWGPGSNITEHLIVTKDDVDHIHVHGPIEKKELIKEFATAIYDHADIDPPKAEAISETPLSEICPDQAVFKNRQAIGDILTMTCAIRDIKLMYPQMRVGVATTAMHIWDNNPFIEHGFRDEESILNTGPGHLTNRSNKWNLHMCNAFRLDIENKLGIPITQGDIRPDIWMTEEEYNKPPLIEGPYWVIIVGGEPGWTAKMYPADRWQWVINQLKDKIQFVQLGMAKHPYAHLENVIDYIGKTEDKNTGIRDLFNIFLHAQGSVGLVSMHMHLSAVFNNPCVVVAGAREPAWFTHYKGHQYIETTGSLPCAEHSICWRCDVTACPSQKDGMPKCIDIIHPGEVSNAIERYYVGGRLEYGKKAKKDFFKGIVKEAQVHQAGEKVSDLTLPRKYGFEEWGDASITERDWEFINQVIKNKGIKTVLEFGTGLSTFLMSEMVDQVVSFDTREDWIRDILTRISALKAPFKNIRLKSWDGKSIKGDVGKFDMAFVDGPSGGANREFSTKIASEVADVVIVHDAGRKDETRWQERYLKSQFVHEKNGGHRCALWAKDTAPQTHLDTSRPLLRLISTARGWGGCARSITTIMDYLIKANWRVEFVPFHGKHELGTGIGGEFKQCLNSKLRDVVVRDYSYITKPCDITFVYADDYIWEFNRPDLCQLFSKLNTGKKIMMVNYRQGKIGKIEWTTGWDKYMFLNSTQENSLKELLPGIQTKVLPPCVDLTEFLKVKPYDGETIKIVRHSSQGDTKFDKQKFVDEVRSILAARPDTELHFMPGPSFLNLSANVFKYQRNQPPVHEFLSKGNLFYYSLPPGYMDMGPRVALEAMAAGLPIIADNWGGCKDRVTPETGWLCNDKSEYAEIIGDLTSQELQRMGEAAKQRALDHFVPERWIEEIIT